jgi:hypothetical protein
MSMKTMIAIAGVLAGMSAAYAEDFAQTAVSGPATWKRYDVRGVQLGQTRASLVKRGFTCGKRANQRCFKIMDKRCESGTCKFKEDAFGQWFELDGAKTKLEYMTVATSETDAARIYDIKLYFGPRQLLTSDSTLGKALIGKYGTPTKEEEPDDSDPNGGGRWIFWNPEIGNNGPEIIVDCNAPNNERGGMCSLDAEDYGVVAVDKAKQEDRDKQKVRAAQPAVAPEL